ncbi:unnamed protein product [Euphydryas editha]|uniref:Uncharacterized protein n=1 Tax=Euphydryas editha TaxID=104508 RepID=A0AAU9TE15_EUPED|nr:unnamed protein product [Euphydryas editha]
MTMSNSNVKEPEDGQKIVTGDLDVDKLMCELGQAGRFHVRMYVLVALAAVQVGLLHTTYIFLAADLPYRCCMTTVFLFNSSFIIILSGSDL